MKYKQNMHLTDKIKEFEKISFDEKRKKCFNMLEILKWNWWIFDDLYEILNNMEDQVSEDLLLSIYTSIQRAICNINGKNLQVSFEKMKKVSKKLEGIKQAEAESLKDNNPDDLLNLI